MTQDDIRVIRYHRDISRRFGHWVFFQDKRPTRDTIGVRGRKNLIRYLESVFGPLGLRWNYEKTDQVIYILKLDDEKDLVIFLLKYKGVK